MPIAIAQEIAQSDTGLEGVFVSRENDDPANEGNFRQEPADSYRSMHRICKFTTFLRPVRLVSTLSAMNLRTRMGHPDS